MPSSFKRSGELPETLRLQVVKTYGDAIAGQLNPDELEIASAIACFDVLEERGEFTDDKYKELLTLLTNKEERARFQWRPEVWRDLFRTLVQVQVKLGSADTAITPRARGLQMEIISFLFTTLREDPKRQ